MRMLRSGANSIALMGKTTPSLLELGLLQSVAATISDIYLASRTPLGPL